MSVLVSIFLTNHRGSFIMSSLSKLQRSIGRERKNSPMLLWIKVKLDDITLGSSDRAWVEDQSSLTNINLVDILGED